MGKAATVKETCYGCLVEGPKAMVREILAAIREKYPYEVFSKVRAYPAGDPRRCRAQHGSRPGYAQLEAEWGTLPLISHGLKCADDGIPYKPYEEKKQFPIDDFKRMCEASK